jgi:hypothetical protein
MNVVKGDAGITQEMLDAEIQMDDLLGGPPTLYYFNLSAPDMLPVSGLCGRLPIFPLIRAAKRRKRNQQTHVLIVQDEYQISAAPNAAHAIQQLREFGVSWVFAYHYFGQLTDRDMRLDETVMGCSSWFIACDIPNAETRDEIEWRLGTKPRLERRWDEDAGNRRVKRRGELGGITDLVGYSEIEDVRLSRNQLLRLATEPQTAFFWVKKRDGLTDMPFATPFRWSHFLTRSELDVLLARPPISLPGQMIVQPNPFPPERKRKRRRKKDAAEDAAGEEKSKVKGAVEDRLKGRGKKK